MACIDDWVAMFCRQPRDFSATVMQPQLRTCSRIRKYVNMNPFVTTLLFPVNY